MYRTIISLAVQQACIDIGLRWRNAQRLKAFAQK